MTLSGQEAPGESATPVCARTKLPGKIASMVGVPGGRPPKPQALRALHGEKRPSRTRIEPQPADRPPEAPEWLSIEARGVWGRTLPELAHMDLLFAADTDVLAAYCSCAARFAECEQILQADGLLYTDPNGQRRRHPLLFVRRDALEGMLRTGQALGLSPAARAHMGIRAPVPTYSDVERLLTQPMR